MWKSPGKRRLKNWTKRNEWGRAKFDGFEIVEWFQNAADIELVWRSRILILGAMDIIFKAKPKVLWVYSCVR